MTVREALREGTRALEARSLDERARGERAPGESGTAALDASLILAQALSVDRTKLLSSGPEPVGEPALARFREGIEARSGGLPLAYILGRKEFWGRDFAVDTRVLVPRPDTETLVEAALEVGDLIAREREARGESPSAARGRPLRVHECCTGSGCVAVTLAIERPEWAVSASDISEAALEVARSNAASLMAGGGRATFVASDLLGAFGAGAAERGAAGAEPRGAQPPFDLVLANPPYVPTSEARALLARGWSEPLLALDGGPDGLDALRRLLPQAAWALAPGGALIVEADGGQAGALAELFRATRFEAVETRPDLAGRARVTIGRKPWTR